MADGDRSRRHHMHRPPYAAGVPVDGQMIAVAEGSRDRSFRLQIFGSTRGDFDRKKVFISLEHLLGYLELMGEEITLGVADVRAVEPHIALVEDAVEAKPDSILARRNRRVEPVPVQQRAIDCGQFGRAGPVPRHYDGRPSVFAEVALVEAAAEFVVRRVRCPLSRELHSPDATRARAARFRAGPDRMIRVAYARGTNGDDGDGLSDAFASRRC